MLKFIIKMAFRNMLRQKRRSFLTLFLIVIAYLLVSISLSIAEGSYNLIIKKFTSNFVGHVRIQQKGFDENPSLFKVIHNYKNLSGIVEKKETIQSHTPRVLGASLAYSHNKNSPAQVIGLDLTKEKSTTSFLNTLPREFNLNERSGVFPVIVSKTIQKKLKLKLNDEIILIGNAYDGSIANDKFFVKAVLENEELIGPWFILMDLKKSQEFFGLDDKVHQIIITEKKFNTALLIQKDLKEKTTSKQDLEVLSWQEVAKEFHTSMVADKKGNEVTIFIIVLLAVLTVLNTVLMAVLERIPEFGLLRALGTKSSQIVSLIFMEVFFLASLGCSLGLFLGYFLNLWFVKVGFKFDANFDVGGMQFDRITGEISFHTLGTPFLIILASCLIASIYPALKAISQDPVTSLRSQ